MKFATQKIKSFLLDNYRVLLRVFMVNGVVIKYANEIHWVEHYEETGHAFDFLTYGRVVLLVRNKVDKGRK